MIYFEEFKRKKVSIFIALLVLIIIAIIAGWAIKG